jgi:putative transposase
MIYNDTLQPDTCYHIFNHANGFENVFREAENYRYFIEKYQLYISPIAETYAWCLMPNQFHFVIRIRKSEVLEKIIINSTFPKFGTLEKLNIIEKYLSKQFANFFSCYTQSFNKMYQRRGSLFIKNFKRDPILDKEHLLNAIIYTHRNPIHHGFRSNYNGWDNCSYPDIIHEKNEIIDACEVLKIFGGKDQFLKLHRISLDNFKLIGNHTITDLS